MRASRSSRHRSLALKLFHVSVSIFIATFMHFLPPINEYALDRQLAAIIETGAPSVAESAVLSTSNATGPSSIGSRTFVGRSNNIILHIGPPKMATTFLQCVLSQRSMAAALRRDNYVYLGRVPGRVCSDGKSMVKSTNLNRDMSLSIFNNSTKLLSSRFLSMLEGLQERGENAIVVDEYLSSVRVGGAQRKALLDYLTTHQWTVQIIVGYRPLFEYMPSQYAQMSGGNKMRPYEPWPNEAANDGEHLTGRSILPFDLVNRGPFTNRFKAIETKGEHPTDLARTLWGFSNNTVNDSLTIPAPVSFTIIPLHNLPKVTVGDSMLTYIFCNAISTTKHICQKAQQGRLGMSSSGSGVNSAFPINYDLLAVAASAKGILKTRQVRRSEAVLAIQRRQEKELKRSPSDFASMKCLPAESMQRLLDLSIRLEEKVFADQPHHRNITAHREAFDRYQSKFCHIDAAAVLDQDESGWRSFLQSL